MDKMKEVLLNQLDGQENKQYCPGCKRDTIYIYHKSGIATCSEPGCDCKAEIDLTKVVTDLKSMGVFVS